MDKSRNILREAGRVLTTEFDALTGPGAPYDLSEVFKDTALRLRAQGYAETAYTLWRGFNLKNPKNRQAGKVGGKTAASRMNRDQRRARARKGGNKVFHGDVEGSDGVRASNYGWLRARDRWNKG